MDKTKIILTNSNRGIWLYELIQNINGINFYESEVDIVLPQDMQPDKFEPFHIVLLACFIEHLNKNGCSNIRVLCNNADVIDICRDKLKIHKYFQGSISSNHEESEDDTILNLWKVVNSESYAYSLSIGKYFSNNYFKDLDTSGLISALNEVYANIADHSQSQENAFSYISYNPDKEKIYIAACDFGLGIPTTLRNVNKKYKTDSDALRDSIEIGVTAKSTKGNKGMGLDNILSTITSDDTFRIISNKSLLVCLGTKNNIKTYNLNFDFKGTLIYFELSTKSFPIKEIEEIMIL